MLVGRLYCDLLAADLFVFCARQEVAASGDPGIHALVRLSRTGGIVCIVCFVDQTEDHSGRMPEAEAGQKLVGCFDFLLIALATVSDQNAKIEHASSDHVVGDRQLACFFFVTGRFPERGQLFFDLCHVHCRLVAGQKGHGAARLEIFCVREIWHVYTHNLRQ